MPTNDTAQTPLQTELQNLIGKGLSFSDCVAAFAETAENNGFIQAAKNEYHEPGRVEIDDRTQS